jgi:hypothetical protein
MNGCFGGSNDDTLDQRSIQCLDYPGRYVDCAGQVQRNMSEIKMRDNLSSDNVQIPDGGCFHAEVSALLFRRSKTLGPMGLL